MNTDNFIIDSDTILSAQRVCKYIEDTDIRNRSVANFIGSEIATQYFDKEKFDINTENSLHKIAYVLENIEISDIYVNGNYIDVRIYFNENELSIPASHVENQIFPQAYMFIKLDEELSSANVIGFIKPEDIDTTNKIDDYYYIKEEDLVSFYEIEDLLGKKDSEENYNEKDLYDFLDNNLSDKAQFIKQLLCSQGLREKLQKVYCASNSFKFISLNNLDNITKDSENSNSDLELDANIENIKEIEEDVIDLNSNENLELVEEIDDIDVLNNNTEEMDILASDSTYDSDINFNQENNNVEDSSSEISDLDSIENSDIAYSDENEDLLLNTSNTEDELNVIENETIDLDIDNLVDVDSPITNIDNEENDDDLNLISEENSNIDIVDEITENNISEPDKFELIENSEENETLSLKQDTEDIDISNKDDINELESQLVTNNVEEENESIIDNELNSYSNFSVIEESDHETEIIKENNNNISEENQKEENNNITEEVNDIFYEEDDSDLDTLLNTNSNEPEQDFSETVDKNIKTKNITQKETQTFNTNITTNETSEETDQGMESSEDDIDKLFNREVLENQSKKKSKIPALLGLIIIIAAGYMGYTKFFNHQESSNIPKESITNNTIQNKNTINKTAKLKKDVKKEAMPVESIEKKEILNKNEGISTSIPAIENNLDATIEVTDLKVNWEVPSGYTSNSSAKRYLIKLGKIIQLNLKAELLLLSKPPISDKIAVEIQYNELTKHFETVGITISSGEKSVDDVILQVINMALGMKLNVNTDSFTKLQGNPILVINL